MNEEKKYIKYLKLLVMFAFICLSQAINAQKDLQINNLFNEFGTNKKVTMVKLSGDILQSYNMTTYKSLVFEDITPYLERVLECLEKDAQSNNIKKKQEIIESGQLNSAYYELEKVKRGKQTVNRYILFKRNRSNKGTLVYIEGGLNEKELMNILYNK